MTTILVTGANGQLGNELRVVSRGVQSAQYKFIFTDISADDNTRQLDITNPNHVDQAIAEFSVDVIINCAAYTNVDRSQSEPELATKINTRGVEVLAGAAKSGNATLVHVSTDYVFDGSKRTPYLESDPTAPLGVYGQTKLAGEQALLDSGCKGVIVRTAWLYSSFGNNFVKTMMRLGRERDQLSVVCDQSGTPTYAADLAGAIMSVVAQLSLTPQYGEIYHFTDAGQASWYDFATQIIALSRIDCRVLPITTDQYPTIAARPSYSVLSKTKIEQQFKIVPPQWQESLKKCISLIDKRE